MIQTISLSRLGGFKGSNPEILCTFPTIENLLDVKDEIIKNSLPDGVLPNSFSLLRVGDKHYLSYIFALREKIDTREDLASISVVVDEKRVNLKDFQVLFKYIIEELLNHKKLEITTEKLVEIMEKLYEGINDLKKIDLGNFIIDIPRIVKKNKLKIEKKIEVKGRFS